MKRIFFLLSLCAFLFSCSKSVNNKVTYNISQIVKDGIPYIKINMVFKPNSKKSTKLWFQNDAWGEKDIYNTIHKMNLLDQKGLITKNKDSGWIEISHPSGTKQIHFEYFLKQDFKTDINAQNSYRPIIKKEYFHIFSHNMFMLPENLTSENNKKFDVVLNWNDFPSDFIIHNSFGSEQRVQELKDLTEEEFHSAIFVGGDFRIYSNDIKNNQLVLATRGDWIPFKDAEVFDLLYQTVKVQRSFWKDHSQKYFTVTMMPFPQNEGSSFGGTGLTNSFATSISNNDQSSIEQLRYLFNHELMHNWIGHAIKNENEEEQYWFSEGFTDYFTQKNIAKNKMLGSDTGDFINQMNITIKNLYTSPVAVVPNSEITYDNFWSNRDYEKLPYYRGSVFAFILDLKIKRGSNNKFSLDDVMRDLLQQSKNGIKLNSEVFIKSVNQFISENIDPFFEKHIVKGELYDLSTIFINHGIKFSSKAKVFDQGFSYDKQTKIVTDVVPNSSAYNAGLRSGDLLKGWSIYYGNIEKEIELKILKDAVEKIIIYLPVKDIDLPQLLINEENIKKMNL
ncbi:M1 family aminopeptidase [Aquimarina sp. SS2-1]|uniref:M1 family aminopeptidase n=1 Tax=Aquimarina besae TaxID=3342247 RepID=UPI00366D4DA3